MQGKSLQLRKKDIKAIKTARIKGAVSKLVHWTKQCRIGLHDNNI